MDFSKTELDITILCKVVDNFGDIGFVLRLARELRGKSLSLARTSLLATLSNGGSAPVTPPFSLKLRIVTDNLKSFSLLEPKINPNVSEQSVNDVKIFDWNESEVCLSEFRKNPPKIILECFECGRPEWLENLLFVEKVPNIVHIIMIDYLTAEPYAETFHKLQSLTRSARVQKVNFMPGFTKKTGGLIFSNYELEIGNRNEELESSSSLQKNSVISTGSITRSSLQKTSVVEALETTTLRKTVSSLRGAEQQSNLFNILMFGYPRNYLPVLRALQNFAIELKKSGKSANILLARGAGFESFLSNYEIENRNEELGTNVVSRTSTTTKSEQKNAVISSVSITESSLQKNSVVEALARLRTKRSEVTTTLQTLDFLPQTEWDKLLYSCDLLFVRGEDSLSRACLSGIPFVWHAYPQSEEYQLVKVNALLERMKAHFSSKDFDILQKCWQVYNTTKASESEVESALIAFFLQYNSLCAGFKSFAASLFKNGNFAKHLLEFIFEKCF